MKNDTVKFGLIYGGISILTLVITYFVNPKTMMDLSWWRMLLGFGIAIGLMYLASKKARDKKGGFIPFGEAFVPSLMTYVIGSLLGVVFMYLLINYIDTGLLPILEEGAKEMQESMFDAMGYTEEQKLQAIEQAERMQGGQSGFGLGQLLIGWFTNIVIMGLPISAIIAFILKKEEPMPIV